MVEGDSQEDAMSVVRYCLLLLFALAPVTPVSAQESGERVVKTGAFEEDLYLAGGSVIVDAEVTGDVIAAGGQLAHRGIITQDAILAGGEIDITGRVGDDVRAAGGRVRVNAPVGDHLVVAGGEVDIGPDAEVGGRVWLGGSEVSYEGRAGGELKVWGSTVRIDGRVQGDVTVHAQSLEIGPRAEIAGNLVYATPGAADISTSAQIDGEIMHRRAAEAPRIDWGMVVAGWLLMLLNLLVLGIAFLLLAPGLNARAVEQMSRKTGRSIGFGALFFFLVPPAVVLLWISVVGLLTGFVLFVLYFLFQLLGLLAGLIFFGDRIGGRMVKGGRDRTAGRILGLVVAVLAWGVIQAVPVIGWLATFVLWLFGTGALLLALFTRNGAGGPGRRLGPGESGEGI